MTQFIPSTSYRTDHELMDFVEDAVWEQRNRPGGEASTDGFKARRADIDTPPFATLAAGLGLRSSTAAFVVWPPVAVDTEEVIDFQPEQGDLLRIAGEGWIITRFRQSRFGHWDMVCESEKVDTVDA